MIRRALLMAALVFGAGACRFPGLERAISVAIEAQVNESIRHLVMQRLAMVLVVERLCGCGEADLVAAVGQRIEVRADFSCGELPGDSAPIHVVGFADLGSVQRTEWTRTPADWNAASLQRVCVQFREVMSPATPVAQNDGDVMIVYVGEGRAKRADLQVLCAAFETPERAGMVEVVILSVDRITDLSVVALRR